MKRPREPPVKNILRSMRKGGGLLQRESASKRNKNGEEKREKAYKPGKLATSTVGVETNAVALFRLKEKNVKSKNRRVVRGV